MSLGALDVHIDTLGASAAEILVNANIAVSTTWTA